MPKYLMISQAVLVLPDDEAAKMAGATLAHAISAYNEHAVMVRVEEVQVICIRDGREVYKEVDR